MVITRTSTKRIKGKTFVNGAIQSHSVAGDKTHMLLRVWDGEYTVEAHLSRSEVLRIIEIATKYNMI
mgnify:CR=1 FL=1